MNAIDPNLIAGAAVSELVKSLAKGATAQGLRLLGEVRARFSKDERSRRALANLEADPGDEDYRAYFDKHLRRLLAADVEFCRRITALLPAHPEQTISASGSAVIDTAEQISDGGGVQKIEAADNSRISNVSQTHNTGRSGSEAGEG
jgi:hypothetical protein